MIDKKFIEQILKVNGVPVSAPDEEIKSILIAAKWHEHDVETALLVLHENTDTHEQQVESLHKVFRNGDKLKPETITALLGIESEVNADHLRSLSGVKDPDPMWLQFLKIFIVSIFIACIALVVGMWYFQVGTLHLISL